MGTGGRCVALICGELSGDRLGAGLAEHLLDMSPGIRLVGVGGPRMRAAGVDCWLDCTVFSVMGYWDALACLPRLLAGRARLRRLLQAHRPDAYVGIDAPDLNLPLGCDFRSRGGKYIQYVCPSFWAWRPERAKALKSGCDAVLALLPFERQRCQEQGIACRFVGHPAADSLHPAADRESLRRSLDIDPEKKLLALLPGSRVQELAQHLPIMASAAQIAAREIPGLQVACAVPEFLLARARQMWNRLSSAYAFFPAGGRAHELLAAADAALCKSGTVTLEAALLDCPQAAVYRLSPAAYWLAYLRMGGKVPKSVALPNLVLERQVISEFVQQRADPESLAREAAALLSGSAASQQQRNDYAQIRRLLGGGASSKAARQVLELLA